MKTRVILTCSDEGTRRAYIEKLARSEVQVDAVSSLSELHRRLLETKYNGILIDVRTKMRAAGREKELIHSLLDVFPVVQLNLDKTTGEVRSLFFGQSKGGESIDDFLKNQCSSFEARSIRSDSRKDLNLNILLSETGNHCEADAVRSITLNISKGGCFLYSTREWELQSPVSFIIKELPDPGFIDAEVRWQIPWGSAMRIPGIGIKFIHIGEAQHRSLCDQFNL